MKFRGSRLEEKDTHELMWVSAKRNDNIYHNLRFEREIVVNVAYISLSLIPKCDPW